MFLFDIRFTLFDICHVLVNLIHEKRQIQIGFAFFYENRTSNNEHYRGLNLKLTVPVEMSGLSPSDVGLNLVL